MKGSCSGNHLEYIIIQEVLSPLNSNMSFYSSLFFFFENVKDSSPFYLIYLLSEFFTTLEPDCQPFFLLPPFSHHPC